MGARDCRKECVSAATELQRCWRGRSGRISAQEARDCRKECVSAATELQRCWRGYKSRIQMTMWWDEAETAMLSEIKQAEQQRNAVLLLQRCWRGRRDRLKLFQEGKLSELQLERFLVSLMGQSN